MIRTLAIIAAAAMALSLMCLAGAGALGWRPEESWWRHFQHWDGFDPDWDDDDFSGVEVTRDLSWEGGDSLTFMAPGRITYTQAPEVSVRVTGPQSTVDRLEMKDGVLAGQRRRFRNTRIKVEVTAPAVTRFRINGSGDLAIKDFSQEELSVEINGSGDVTANGVARHTDVEIHGSGNADVSGIDGEEARVEIMGSGDVRIAPSNLAQVTIMGAGDVDLVSDTARVESTIMGSGRINRVSPSSAPTPVAPSQSASPRKTPAAKTEKAPESVAP